MSCFKKLQRKDVFTTVYPAKKNWSAYSASAVPHSPDYFTAISGSRPFYPSDSNYDENLRYDSIRQLYYVDGISGSAPILSYENLPDTFTVISYPQRAFGSNLQPNSIVISGVESYDSASIEQYTYTIEGLRDVYAEHVSGSVIDNGEGKLVLVSALSGSAAGAIIGDIDYKQGLAIVSSSMFIDHLAAQKGFHSIWESVYEVYTMNIKCRIRSGELNHTMNPSANTSGSLNANVTGSEFAPYITTVGLFNNEQELVAVAKLGQPTYKPDHTDMTIVVKLDV